MWQTIKRLIVVPFAFLIAAMFAIAIILTLGMERLTQATTGEFGRVEDLSGFYAVIFSGFELISAATILPAVLVVIVGEVARIRSSIYYTVAGGAALAAIPLLAANQTGGELVLPATGVWQVFAAAGFMAGWLYWMIAGRRA